MTAQHQQHHRQSRTVATEATHPRTAVAQSASPRGAALLTTPVVAVRDRVGQDRELTGAWFVLRAINTTDAVATRLDVDDYDAMLASAGYEQREWLVESHLEKIIEQINEQVARFRVVATTNQREDA
jgi:hypothetical protein